ncbi:MAG: UDP-N-acetylmuramoyl-tripeptide--D-alanyl-D-alanine ligase, partial [Candidatus Acidiferrum sp.]
GSAGKTTTKEAIAHLLAVRFRVFKSQGNLNNHFGLPLQLLRLERSHDVAVVELGMSHAGEIAALARIAQPEIGVVTLVAPVHLEFFDSIEGIARAKQELIAALPEAGIAVLNADDPYVSQFGRGFRGRVLTFGISHPADFRAHKVQMKGALGSSFEVISHGATAPVSLPLLGLHNVYNALAALAVASERGVPLPEAASALASFAPVANRGELLRLAGATVINDCYNCNPAALNAMVDALMELPAARHIVVAGGMLELGPDTERLHRECGRHMAERNVDVVLGVCALASAIVQEARAHGVTAEFVETPQQAGDWLAREARSGDAILLKASRGVRLEAALESWKAALAKV